MITSDCSVIIPCHNQGGFLHECLASIAAQTVRPREIIIVNDGSTDEETKRILCSDAIQSRTVVLNHEEAQGPPIARNVGIRHAQGKFILPVDADDKIAPCYIEKAIDVLNKNPQVGIVCGEGRYFGTRSGPVNFPQFSKPRMALNNCIVVTAVFRKADWDRVGGYCIDFKAGLEDWDFYLSLLEAGLEYHHLDEVVYYYRQHANNATHALRRNTEIQAKLYRLLVERHKVFFREHGDEALLLAFAERTQMHKLQMLNKHPLISVCRKFLRFIGQY